MKLSINLSNLIITYKQLFVFYYEEQLYDASVYLSNNILTRLESSVFEEMLQKMAFSETGILYLTNSTIFI